MHDLSKNKMAGVNSRFASVLRIQEDAVPENTRKAMKFGLKVQRIEKTYRCSTFEQFQEMSLTITDFRQVAFHSALAEINAASFFGKSIKCYSTKHVHKFSGERLCARRHLVLLLTRGIIYG